ncbi:hypothetical protein [Haloarcula montana]|uniref:hypothetical protein n=1 Tax=Haloarcula montana TaxID=3111776 RepID=UPI002D7991EA|nr:hypothetical protein [Haloarcula sp. GH36]
MTPVAAADPPSDYDTDHFETDHEPENRHVCTRCEAVSPEGEVPPPSQCAGGSSRDPQHRWKEAPVRCDGGTETYSDKEFTSPNTDVYDFAGGNVAERANAVLGAVDADRIQRLRIEVETAPKPVEEPTAVESDAEPVEEETNGHAENPVLNPETQTYDAVMAIVEADAEYLTSEEVAERKDTWDHRGDPTNAATKNLRKAHKRGFLERDESERPYRYRVAPKYRRTLLAEKLAHSEEKEALAQ